MDPSPQPLQLSNLTKIEEMLIACLNPILQVTHVIGCQIKYKMHTISSPQEVREIAKILPHRIKDLPIIIVRKKDQHGTSYNFTVNKERVYKALQFKINHDKFYRDVQIDENALSELTSNSDDNSFDQLNAVHMEFDLDANEYLFVGPITKMDQGNIINHTTSMVSKPPNAKREM